MEGGKHSLETFGVPTENELRVGDPQDEIVAEIKSGKYDLVVLGAPLPERDGRISLSGVVEGVMRDAGNCSLLIVRSHYHKNALPFD
jgi:nucleotide-binding universal stress UspA family protein